MFPKYLVNPYLGVFCSGFTFNKMFNLIPEKEYKNKQILGFILLKSCSIGVVSSIVPITTLVVGRNLYQQFV